MTFPGTKVVTGRARFGGFELDCESGELTKDGVRVTLPEQPLAVLLALLERPQQLVTREELCRRIWPADTFVDFEHGLNAAVKRLRDALGDSADAPRFVETVPRRGYRLVAAVESPTASAVEAQPEPDMFQLFRKAWGRIPWLAVAAVAIAAAASAFLFLPSNFANSDARLLRVTFDAGLQMDPAWSPDGSLIAYASDRDGHFDIWVQPVTGGDAIKLTTGPEHNTQPHWSPDGQQIAFRSERDGGGIYVVPALGGAARRVASFGYHPRWSPDGTRILFSSTDPPSNSSSKVYVASLDGGSVVMLRPSFLGQFWPMPTVKWHPDGRISVWGSHTSGNGFWTFPADGDAAPIRSTWSDDIDRLLANLFFPGEFDWAPSRDAVYFTGRAQDVQNIWKVAVDRSTLEWASRAERVTMGSGPDTKLAISADGRRLAFANVTRTVRIWALPADPAEGTTPRQGNPLTPTGGVYPVLGDVSRDGRLAFSIIRPGSAERRIELCIQSLDNNRERVLRVEKAFFAWPRWSPDGTRLAYALPALRVERAADQHRTVPIRILNVETGREESAAVPSSVEFGGVLDWSPDGKRLVTGRSASEPFTTELWTVPIGSGDQPAARLVSVPRHGMGAGAALSPDGRWVAFTAWRTDVESGSALFVARLADGTAHAITDYTRWHDRPRWSADGRTIYFMSSDLRGASLFNVWGLHVDTARGSAVGAPFQITQLESPAYTIDAGEPALALWRNRLILPIAESSGGIWMMDGIK